MSLCYPEVLQLPGDSNTQHPPATQWEPMFGNSHLCIQLSQAKKTPRNFTKKYQTRMVRCDDRCDARINLTGASQLATEKEKSSPSGSPSQPQGQSSVDPSTWGVSPGAHRGRADEYLPTGSCQTSGLVQDPQIFPDKKSGQVHHAKAQARTKRRLPTKLQITSLLRLQKEEKAECLQHSTALLQMNRTKNPPQSVSDADILQPYPHEAADGKAWRPDPSSSRWSDSLRVVSQDLRKSSP